MRLGLLMGMMFLAATVLVAQDSSNPFELVPRLSPEQREAPVEEPVETSAPVNPFDIVRPGTTPAAPENPSTSTPSPVEQAPSEQASEQAASPEVEANEGESVPKGWRLVIALVLLVFTAVSLLFFRSTYARSYRAMFNDNLLSQLYREREAGALGSFLIMYGVFFAAAGFFMAIAGQHFEIFPADQIWRSTWQSASGLLALLLFRHILLSVLGYVFPIAKETRRYSFAIMVFWIIGGLILSLGALLLAYAPEGAEEALIWGTIGLLVLLYLLRSLRGFFIANRFIFNYQFHFLSYICAVEIGPALCLIKILTDFQ